MRSMERSRLTVLYSPHLWGLKIYGEMTNNGIRDLDMGDLIG
jgi:hypothetical protein